MSSFINRFGGNTQTMAHSGYKSLQNALNSGMTINQIRDLTAREGVSFGQRAQDFLNARSPNSFIAKYGGNANTMANSGYAALERALADGLTINQIRDRAKNEGISWGNKASSFLAERGPGTFIAKYGGDAQGMKASGLESLKRAFPDMTLNEIRAQTKNEGVKFGPKAQEVLDRNPMASLISTYGGNYVTNNAGMRAIEGALESGMTINQIRDQGTNESVNWGAGATDFFKNRDANSFIAKYGGNAFTMKHSGLNSVLRALNSGMSAKDIQKAGVDEGISWGERAAQYLADTTSRQEYLGAMNIAASSLGNNQNASGVRTKTSAGSKTKQSEKGTYSLNRSNYSPLMSILGIKV